MKKILSILLIVFSMSAVYAVDLNAINSGYVDLMGTLEKFKNYSNDNLIVKQEILSKVIKEASKQLNEIDSLIANQQTKSMSNAGCQKISQTLWEGKVGQSQSDVRILQNYLNKFGKENSFETEGLIVTGVYNDSTTWWVKAFQRKYKIKQTGAVGQITLAKINSMICGEEQKIKVSIETPGESGLLGDKSKFEASWAFGGKYPKNSYLTLSLKRLQDGYEGYVWPYIGVPTQSNKGTFNLNCLYNCEGKSGQSSGKYKLVAKIVYCSNINVTDNRFCENNINGLVTGDKMVSVDVSDKIENNPIYLQFIGNLKLENFQQ